MINIYYGGVGVKLDYANITTEAVLWAVNEVLDNLR
jgi:hypothetical protein